MPYGATGESQEYAEGRHLVSTKPCKPDFEKMIVAAKGRRDRINEGMACMESLMLDRLVPTGEGMNSLLGHMRMSSLRLGEEIDQMTEAQESGS